MPAGKKYLDLTDSERRQYIADRAMKIAQIIGNSSSEPIPPEAIEKIKSFTDAYAKRIFVKPLSGCRFGDNLQATYERASKTHLLSSKLLTKRARTRESAFIWQ